MRASVLKLEKPFERLNAKGIQFYGEHNDFPQKVQELLDVSITGGACADTYHKFVFGKGFAIADFAKTKCNKKGDTFDDVLFKVSEDFTRFGGFAIHLNYNALYKVVSISHIPFECLRLEEMTSEKPIVKRVAYHPDWGARDVRLRRFSSEEIVWFDLFNPDAEYISERVFIAGGWDKWTGQVLYYSNRGTNVYPAPMFVSALTDMSTEDGLSNIAYRNARNNFLTAGMLIDYDNNANSDEQEQATRDELKEFQGDTNAGKLFYVNIRNGEQKPEFVPFSGENRDSDYKNAEVAVPERIGMAFRQPPVLRGRAEASGFDTERIKQAYTFYNSLTENERQTLSSVFERVCKLMRVDVNPENDYTILPKTYDVSQSVAEKLGNMLDRVLEIIKDETMNNDRKVVILRELYGLDDETIEKLI